MSGIEVRVENAPRFAHVPKGVLTTDVSLGARCLWALLATYAWHDGAQWFVTRDTLAEELHASPRSVTTWTQELEKADLLAVERRQDRNLPSVFTIKYPVQEVQEVQNLQEAGEESAHVEQEGEQSPPSVRPSTDSPDDLLDASVVAGARAGGRAGTEVGKLMLVDSEPTRLAVLLSEAVRHNMDTPAGSKKYAATPAWAAEIERMHRIDGREWEHIERCIRWLRDGADPIAAFWRPNIGSARKLREKFDTMAAQLREAQNKTTKPNPRDEQWDMLARLHAEAKAEEAAAG